MELAYIGGRGTQELRIRGIVPKDFPVFFIIKLLIALPAHHELLEGMPEIYRMGYHIDFLPIGEKKCGEAIALHLGDLKSSDRTKRKVIIIDGGYKDNGDEMVEHILTKYQTNEVDLVISTHPDQDHINGLSTVLEKLKVNALWMHQPWKHSQSIDQLRRIGFNASSVSDKIENALSAASDLEAVANRMGVPILEPFVDECVFDTPQGRISILGPTREFYEELLLELLDYVPTQASAFSRAVQAIASVFETHHIETLDDSGSTSPQNNSSTILLLETDTGKRALFTGDAGAEALHQACDRLVLKHGHIAGSLNFVQVPHHGSRRNVGPAILDRLLGAKTASADTVIGSSYVSVAKDNCKQGHPKKVVTNAFKRRGYPVHSTSGLGLLQHSHGDDRSGWSSSTPLPHFDYVESQE